MTKHKNDTASKGATMMQAIDCVGWQKLLKSFFNTVKLLSQEMDTQVHCKIMLRVTDYTEDPSQLWSNRNRLQVARSLNC